MGFWGNLRGEVKPIKKNVYIYIRLRIFIIGARNCKKHDFVWYTVAVNRMRDKDKDKGGKRKFWKIVASGINFND